MEADKDFKNPLKVTKHSGFNINLIPDVPEEEKKKIEKKETFSLSSAVFIFLIMLFTVILLLFNFSLRTQKTNAEIGISVANSRLKSLQSKELTVKNINSKYLAISQLKKEDLQYFFLTEEVTKFPTNVKIKKISLDGDSKFAFSGLATNPSDFNNFVLSLEDNEYFSDINIDEMNKLNDEQIQKARDFNEGQYTVSWQLSGYFFRGVTRGEMIEILNSLNNSE